MVSKLDSFLFTLPAFFCANAALPQLPLPSCPQTDRSAALPRYLRSGADAVCAFLYRNQRGDGILHRRHCLHLPFLRCFRISQHFLDLKDRAIQHIAAFSCIASQIQAVRISDDLCQGTDIRFRFSRSGVLHARSQLPHRSLPASWRSSLLVRPPACLPVLLP